MYCVLKRIKINYKKIKTTRTKIIFCVYLPLFCLLCISHTYLTWQLRQLDLEGSSQERSQEILVEGVRALLRFCSLSPVIDPLGRVSVFSVFLTPV